jgi:hypothetical protein
MKIWVWPAGAPREVEAIVDPNWTVGGMVRYELDGVRMRALRGEYSLDRAGAVAKLEGMRDMALAVARRQAAALAKP